jgi:hypothetical protein
MTNAVPRLEVSIKNHFSPLLREDGFAGSGRTFRRTVEDVVQVVNVQSSRYGGEFAINLALQPLAIPDALGNSPDPKKITESLCEFRRRLAESGADQWWQHDATQTGMDRAVREAAEVYVRVGRMLFDGTSGPTSALHAISPAQLEKSKFYLNGFGTTKVRLALALARLRKANGNLAEAKEFADYGLARVGSAVALRRELEALCASA